MYAPSATDVVVRQTVGNAGTIYVLATQSGPDLCSFRSPDEAILQALRYAMQAHRHAWFVTADGDVLFLCMTGNGRGLTRDQSHLRNGASRTPAAAESAIAASDLTMAAWIRRIRAEYFDVSGLVLTDLQVRRLGARSPETCQAICAALLDVKLLTRKHRRTSCGHQDERRSQI